MERALGDDCLRRVLTFVSVADCARGAGAASKHLRDLATSTTLARARGADSYALRGPLGGTLSSLGGGHGVVHALATAFGLAFFLPRAPGNRSALRPNKLKNANSSVYDTFGLSLLLLSVEKGLCPPR